MGEPRGASGWKGSHLLAGHPGPADFSHSFICDVARGAEQNTAPRGRPSSGKCGSSMSHPSSTHRSDSRCPARGHLFPQPPTCLLLPPPLLQSKPGVMSTNVQGLCHPGREERSWWGSGPWSTAGYTSRHQKTAATQRRTTVATRDPPDLSPPFIPIMPWKSEHQSSKVDLITYTRTSSTTSPTRVACPHRVGQGKPLDCRPP